MPKPTLDFKAHVFQCPHCGISAKHKWYNIAKGIISEHGINYYEEFIPNLYMSLCAQCNRYTYG